MSILKKIAKVIGKISPAAQILKKSPAKGLLKASPKGLLKASPVGMAAKALTKKKKKPAVASTTTKAPFTK